MSDLNRQYAQRLMEEAGLDALVLFQPEAFRYAIGESAGVATMWRRAGAAIAIVPADANAQLAAVASDHAASRIRHAAPQVDLRVHRVWIDMVDLGGVPQDAADAIPGINAAYRQQHVGGPRPENVDQAVCFSLLGDILRERGLARARIGADLEFMPTADFERLKHALPSVVWVDGSEILRRLRAVKSVREIHCLRHAARAAEAGFVRMTDAVREGASVGDLSLAWRSGAQEAASTDGFALSGHWDFISVGPDLSDLTAKVVPGSLIKADVGTLVDGYSSDGARTFSYGKPSRMALEVFAALETAFHAGLDEIRPGNSFGAVHAAMLGSMRKDGFEEYYRGHFGHSVGASVGMEEWPFFSTGNPETILPGMVVALEAPFYGQGLGALMIEDQFLVTETGVDAMNTLPRNLVDLKRD